MKIAFFGDSLTEGFPGVGYYSLLKQKYPEFRLFNYGRGGDTVLSLLNRLKSQDLPTKFDLAFIWVGVNDVFVKVSSLYPFLKRLRRQPWAKNPALFRLYYKELLTCLGPRARFLLAVSPLFIGEDRQNPWNRELEGLNSIIKELSLSKKNCEFIDLREGFREKQVGVEPSPYIPKSFVRIALDTLTLKTPRAVERESSKRGLQWTIDGVHLNNEGACLVAQVFMEVIEGKKKILFQDG